MPWTHEHSWKLEATPERVFAALMEPAQLTRWFTEHAEIVPQPGGDYRFWGKHTLGTPRKGSATQRITRLEQGRVLAFSWMVYGVDTQVTLALASEGDGSRLTLHHEIKGELPLPRPKELIDDHWRLAFGNLTAFLADGTGLLLPDYTDPSPEIRMKLTINAPPEVVFQALITPESINQWFGTQSAEVDPRPGGKYLLSWKYQVDGRDVMGGPTKILELVPGQKLVLDWPDWRGDASVSGQTITFLLKPAGKGTELTFVHAGFSRTADISDYGFGWPYFLGLLVETIQGGKSVGR
jgi:uncharacterized protein YndB with AHSA1/START domain